MASFPCRHGLVHVRLRGRMTDWLPWGAALMAGTFATIGLALRSLGRTPVGQRPDLRHAKRALLATVVLSVALFALYLAFGERWIWYQ
jgi:hypothetical protein